MPTRIQRRRTKGWKMPRGAVYVGRPSIWGNPICITPEVDERGQKWFRVHGSPMDRAGGPAYVDVHTARHFAARYFEWDLRNGRYGHDYPSIAEIQRKLAGRDLACWCPLPRILPNGMPSTEVMCHADVLLDIANTELELSHGA
jgi:hypothetical protein